MHNLAVVFTLEAKLLNDSSVVITHLVEMLAGISSYIHMTSPNMYKENRENGSGTSLPPMVIEVEGLGESETRLGLIVDAHLVATNLTTAQMKFLVGAILNRIDVFEEEKEPERQLH